MCIYLGVFVLRELIIICSRNAGEICLFDAEAVIKWSVSNTNMFS